MKWLNTNNELTEMVQNRIQKKQMKPLIYAVMLLSCGGCI